MTPLEQMLEEKREEFRKDIVENKQNYTMSDVEVEMWLTSTLTQAFEAGRQSERERLKNVLSSVNLAEIIYQTLGVREALKDNHE